MPWWDHHELNKSFLRLTLVFNSWTKQIYLVRDNCVITLDWKKNLIIHYALRRPTDATKPDGLQQVFGSFHSSTVFKWPPHTNRRDERRWKTSYHWGPKNYQKLSPTNKNYFLRPLSPADATKRDSHELAKTIQFRRVGWCVEGIRLFFRQLRPCSTRQKTGITIQYPPSMLYPSRSL